MADYPRVVPYSVFEARHPSYDEKHWKVCRALYAGGRKLLCDSATMKDVFPKHTVEPDLVYQERLKRAYFLPYPGEIIDSIVAQLTAAPVKVTGDPVPTGAEATFYQEFCEDVSKPGGKRQSLNLLLREQAAVALQCQTAWTLVDLPRPEPTDEALPATTYQQQVESGQLRAYACPIAPENVVDWEEDSSGELVWAIVRSQAQKRAGLTDKRDKVAETWTWYDREGWAQYYIEYSAEKPPGSDTEVNLVDQGEHSFGRVPLARLALPDGLAAMEKICHIAIAHLNKRNALEWAQLKSLLPTPVAYLQQADPMNPITTDEGRAMQPHAVGRMRVMAEKDRLEYFGPDPAPFEFAGQDLSILRDEMHRVLHHMALSVDNSGAALQRSADSKSIDQAATSVVLGALGQIVREHAIEIYRLVAAGRGDAAMSWTAEGMDDFDDITSGSLIEQAMNLEAVQIPSATFQVQYRFGIAKKLLGPKTSDKMLDEIKAQLETALTPELYQAINDADHADAEMRKRQAENAPDDPIAAQAEARAKVAKPPAK